jgi:hypothetical protein
MAVGTTTLTCAHAAPIPSHSANVALTVTAGPICEGRRPSLRYQGDIGNYNYHAIYDHAPPRLGVRPPIALQGTSARVADSMNC